MKVKIGRTDWYPVYTLEDTGPEAEVPDEIVERYRRVVKEFNAIQDELCEYLDEGLYALWKKQVVEDVLDLFKQP